MSCTIAYFQNINCSVGTITFCDVETPGAYEIQITNANTKKSWWFILAGETAEIQADISSVTWDVGVPYEFEVFEATDPEQKGVVDFQEAQSGATTYPYNKGSFQFNNVIGGTATLPTSAILKLKE